MPLGGLTVAIAVPVTSSPTIRELWYDPPLPEEVSPWSSAAK